MMPSGPRAPRLRFPGEFLGYLASMSHWAAVSISVLSFASLLQMKTGQVDQKQIKSKVNNVQTTEQ